MKTALYIMHNRTKIIPSCLYDITEVNSFTEDYQLKYVQYKDANVVMWDLFHLGTRHPIGTESFVSYWTRGNEWCSIILVVRLRGFFIFEKNNMMRSALYDITPCNPLKVNRSFGGTCFHETNSKLHSGFCLAYCSSTWRKKRHVPSKHQLTFNGLCDFMSQKVELFIATFVKILNL
jgi:hypothetical protein